MPDIPDSDLAGLFLSEAKLHQQDASSLRSGTGIDEQSSDRATRLKLRPNLNSRAIGRSGHGAAFQGALPIADSPRWPQNL